MKVLVINGSPRLENSNTMQLTRAFVEGFASVQDIEVEQIDVYRKNIQFCLGCFSCWKRTPGKCVLKDDMPECLEKLIAADVIIWSFPLYYYSIPGRLKNFIDRQVPTNRPIMMDRYDGRGYGTHPSRFGRERQKNVFISTCGFFTAKGNYDGVTAMMDLVHGQGNYTTLFCGQGEVFNIPKLKDSLSNYLQSVRKAGEDYGNYGIILPETQKKLGEYIMPKADLEAMANSYYAHLEEKAAKREAEEAAAKAAESANAEG